VGTRTSRGPGSDVNRGRARSEDRSSSRSMGWSSDGTPARAFIAAGRERPGGLANFQESIARPSSPDLGKLARTRRYQARNLKPVPLPRAGHAYVRPPGRSRPGLLVRARGCRGSSRLKSSAPRPGGGCSVEEARTRIGTPRRRSSSRRGRSRPSAARTVTPRPRNSGHVRSTRLLDGWA